MPCLLFFSIASVSYHARVVILNIDGPGYVKLDMWSERFHHTYVDMLGELAVL